MSEELQTLTGDNLFDLLDEGNITAEEERKIIEILCKQLQGVPMARPMPGEAEFALWSKKIEDTVAASSNTPTPPSARPGM